MTSKPPISSGSYSFDLSGDELYSVIQVLAFSKDVFMQMSDNYIKEGNEKAGITMRARSELSNILWNKFKNIALIGEPVSRDVH
jgi:hypothetical protein